MRPRPRTTALLASLARPYKIPLLIVLAAIAGSGIVLIATINGVASYVDNYYTESVGQHVANDLRIRVYDHLECLSFSYYDAHETGVLLSTLTDDVATVQEFISTSTLG